MDNVEKKDIVKIADIVPHKYPFLMIDKIIERTPGISATCQKNVSHNEPFFQGHFPGYPVMPGVMITEAMAQTAGIASGRTHGMADVGILASINNAKFKKPVYPGDVLIIEGLIDSIRMNVIKAKTKAYVDGELVAFATFTLVIVPDAFKSDSI
ncbi:MAG: 3-hydroxyacyl-ACP dehydratase FabZ [Clostridiales bacterium]|nr:3-hydroxyacyl-ACP dehydratase FabZ [Clostridiales bacterium]